MKKIVKRPDGTIEEIEGTPEELAQLERAIQEGMPAQVKSKRRVLTDEIKRIARETARDEVRRRVPITPQVIPWTAPSEWGKPWTLGSESKTVVKLGQECIVDAFMRENPGFSGLLGLVCSCPKCAVYCFSTRNGRTENSDFENVQDALDLLYPAH